MYEDNHSSAGSRDSRAILPEPYNGGPRSHVNESTALEPPTEESSNTKTTQDPNGVAETDREYRSENQPKKDDLGYAASPNLIRQEIEGDNHGHVIGVLNQTVRRLLDSHKLSDSYVSECVSVYVQHPQAESCLEILKSHRVIVLTGAKGIGRHTAAIWLLDQLGDIRLREVRREPAEPFNVSDILSDRQAGWILDLRSEDADLTIEFGRSIADEETKTALEQAGSYLVVIARTDLWEKIGNGGRELESSLTEPPPKEVLIRHLQSGTSPLKQHHAHLWSNDSEIEKELSGLKPVEIVNWSSDIRNEHSIALKESDYIELPKEGVENAVQARKNWLDDLLKWHKTNQSPHCRNFILAAAVLDGCRAGEIYSESQNISHFLSGGQEEKDIGQGGPGIYELVDISEAVLKNGDYLTFPKSGYARSIIEYFWVDRMHLRPKFISWLVDTSKHKGGNYDSETFERMGEYILRWCSQRRDIGDLEKILFAWSSNEKLRKSAQDLLTAAAFDPEIGRQVRDKMLAWSKSTDANDIHLQSVIAHACGGPLGTVFDMVMVYRLGHLVESPEPQVREASLKAFDTLWSAEHTRPRIRETITRWLTGNDLSRREVGLNSFVAIAHVTNGFRMAENSHDTQDETWRFYTAGWKSALERKPTRTSIDAAFALWMSNALISRFHEAACTRIIEKSIRSSSASGQATGQKISALTRMLFVWAPAHVDDSRASVRDRIIERASGLDPIRQLEPAPAADRTYD